MEKQRCGRKGLALILGSDGSGKSSLIQAGVLPLLTQSWNGRWRQATILSLQGDPFEILAKALFQRSALPLLEVEYGQWQNLAVELREEPASAALRVKQSLEKMAGLEFEKLVQEQENRLANNRFHPDAADHQRSRRTKPHSYLALVVDQMEDLTDSPPETQRAFSRALGVLSSTEGIFVLAALRDDGQKGMEELAGLAELNGFRYRIQRPRREEFAAIIQSPAEAAGLIFGSNPETGRRLNEILVESALLVSEPLPFLELALSELYRKQSARGDGVLSWDDYQEVVEAEDEMVPSGNEGPDSLERTIGNYAESQLAGLGKNQKSLLWPIIRQLLVSGTNGSFALRTIPYHVLVSSPARNKVYQLNAKILVNHLIEGGLLRSSPNADKSYQVGLMHEVLLRQWPRLWRHFCQERDSLGMRQRLELQRQRWDDGGRQKKNLLADKRSLKEAAILQEEFHPCLTGEQIDFLSKSLGHFRSKPRFVLAAVGGLAVLLIAGGSMYSGLKRIEEIELARADSERHLQAQLKNEKEKVRQAQGNPEQIVNGSSSLDAALKDSERQLQIAQTNVEQLAIQRADLQKQLKDGEGKIKQFQEMAAQAAEKRSALEIELGQMREKLRISQAADADMENRRLGLEGQLREEEEKVRLAEQSAATALTKNKSLEADNEKAQDALRLAQAGVEEANRQRLDLQVQLRTQQEVSRRARSEASEAIASANLQLRNEEEKIREAEANVNAANVRTHALESELQEAQGKAQVAQTNAAEAERLRNGLQLQLKNEQEKTQQAQQDAEQARANADEASSKTLEIKKTQNEQLRGFQALMEMARVTTGYPPARPSLPSSQSASALQAVPSKEKIDSTDENPPDEESLKSFVLEYLQTIAINDVAAQERFFANRVDFYSKGCSSLTEAAGGDSGIP